MVINVDVVILSRGDGPLPAEVERGLAGQAGVRLHVYHVSGDPRPDDPCRWESIARGRNLGKRLGSSPWLMFLDDDVVLANNCVRQLVGQLRRQAIYGALAADYLGQAVWGGPTRHVAMGATLFRRPVLDRIRFRWEPKKCECQCCCDDLRRLGYGIAYDRIARAWHLPRNELGSPSPATCPEQHAAAEECQEGHILAAFDRRHYHLFRDRFLKSLRGAGNDEWVTAVCYGLFPSQRRALERMRHVQLLRLPADMTAAPIRRLRDFQTVLARLPTTVPVAYWDAGDVWFQGSLQSLWSTVAAHPDKLLAVREPISHPQNTAVAEWTLSIQQPASRDRAFRLLSGRPFLNSGFAAATAEAMLRYLLYAHRLRHASMLRGTRDWGDQVVFNLYCHANPESWQEVGQQWNYCLCGRPKGEVYRRRDGRFVSRTGKPIHVVHGNARTLERVPRERQRV
ncbi:MAG: glycosyltransferase family 2 protein [Planctomycetota bacterium]|jgi:hypothetical protein